MEKIWPESNEMGIGWTAKYPRPKEGGPHHPAVLEFRQKQWDEAEKLRVRNAEATERIRAEREAKRQAERDAAAARAEAKRQEQNAATEAMLRRRFLSAGGSPEEWEAEKTDILVEHRRRLVAEGDTAEERARAAHAQLYTNW